MTLAVSGCWTAAGGHIGVASSAKDNAGIHTTDMSQNQPNPPEPIADPTALITEAVRVRAITQSQADQALAEHSRGGDGIAWLLGQGALSPRLIEMLNMGLSRFADIGAYQLMEVIGHGGMGVVYRAVHATLQREVALKVLSEHYASDRVFRERFLREARIAAAIDHPHVVRCHDAGQVDDRLYLAMELVRCGDVEDLVGRSGGRLPEARALEIIRDAAAGLSAVHAAGLIHRDIKPANLLIGDDGRVKLADLGLARAVSGQERLTVAGLTPGTPAYMAPEQARAAPDLDIRADIYALGATLYYLLVGQPPFTGPSQWTVVAQALSESIPDPRQVRPELSAGAAAVVLRAGALDRDQRYGDPTALREDLDAVIAARPLPHAGALQAAALTPPPAPVLGAKLAITQPSGRYAQLPSRARAAPDVLIVDDDPMIAEIYSLRLTRDGFTVRVAGNGVEALAMIAERLPDIVLLDLIMPVVDGTAVIRALRSQERTRHLPIVVLSNTLIDQEVRGAKDAGADRVLSKSGLTPLQVVGELRALLALPTRQVKAVSDSSGDRGGFLARAPAVLRKARAVVLGMTTDIAERTNCRALLPELVRDLRPLTSAAHAVGFAAVAAIAAAAESLAMELYTWPDHIGPSSLRTLAQAIEGMETLIADPAEAPAIDDAVALVIDDDPLSLHTMVEALRKVGIAARPLADPAAALVALTQATYRLVISDVLMPGLNGFQFAARLRALPAGRILPIIFVTGMADFELSFRASTQGGSDVIIKPFLLIELGLKALLQIHRAVPVQREAVG